MAQEPGRLVGRLDDVAKLHGDHRGVDEPLRVKIEAKETYLPPLDLLHHIWKQHTFEGSAGEVVVGREAVGPEGLVMAGEALHPGVELMVAENLDIIAHHVHQRILNVAAEILEIERALGHIAGIHENHVLLGAAHGVDHGLALEPASGA